MIQFKDLAQLLKRFPHYAAVEVFASDVEEVMSAHATRAWDPTVRQGPGPGTFFVSLGEVNYEFRLLQDVGVVSFSPSAKPTGTGDSATVGTIVGSAVAAATRKKGGGVVAGMLLGLLVGKVDDPTKLPERVFTVRFDSERHEWGAYDGGLVNWLKETMPMAHFAS